MHSKKSCFKWVLTIACLAVQALGQSAFMEYGEENVTMMLDGTVLNQFSPLAGMDCYSPQTFIYNDSTHSNYTVHTYNDIVLSVESKYPLA